MTEYAADHDGGLPPASIEPSQQTWDTLLTPYLCSDMAGANSTNASQTLQDAAALRFLCPSDDLFRSHPRTYVMSAHDMQPDNWPPGPDNATGLGLAWSAQAIEALLGADALEQAATSDDGLALVKFLWLPEPAKTLLLTEAVAHDNKLGRPATAALASAGEQSGLFSEDRRRFHHECFNYLMTDGHVELVAPLKIGRAGDGEAAVPSGAWTIRKGD